MHVFRVLLENIKHKLAHYQKLRVYHVLLENIPKKQEQH